MDREKEEVLSRKDKAAICKAIAVNAMQKGDWKKASYYAGLRMMVLTKGDEFFGEIE